MMTIAKILMVIATTTMMAMTTMMETVSETTRNQQSTTSTTQFHNSKATVNHLIQDYGIVAAALQQLLPCSK